MGTLAASLTHPDLDAAGGALPVDDAGLALTVTVPADSELVAAALTLVAPGDDRTLDLLAGPAPAALATSAGPGAPGPTDSVAWFTADWRVRRPLTFLAVTSTTVKRHGRLRLAEDGPWYPPTPDRVEFGDAGQRLPALAASRLMVEVMNSDENRPDTAALTGVSVKVAARPCDLSAALDDGGPVAQHPLPFDPREAWTLRGELLSALQRALGDRGGAATVRLRSSAPGLLHRLELAVDRVPRVRRFAGGAATTSLEIPADGSASAFLEVPADAAVTALGFTVAVALPGERTAHALDPGRAPPLAHRCTPARTAAQGFAPPDAPLTGVDLHLRPLTRGVQAAVSVHPDQFGEPAPAALATLPFEFVGAGDPPWPSWWCTLALPAPLTLPDEPWWLVLTVAQGDLLWHMDDAPVPAAPAAPLPDAAKYRVGADVWLPRARGGPAVATRPAQARARVRLQRPADDPPPTPRLRLRWRGKELALTPDAHGRVELDAAALAPFAPPGDGRIEVVVAVPVAGTVTLSQPSLRLAPTRDTIAFGGT